MKCKFCSQPSEAEIRQEAYRLYLNSGCVPGHDLEHWLAAKARLQAEESARSNESVDRSVVFKFPLHAAAVRVDTPHPFPDLHRRR